MNDFFADSDYLDHMVLRPLSHSRPNWELRWDRKTGTYLVEDDSYAGLLNDLLTELDNSSPPSRYHDNEDCLAEFVVKHLKWPIKKVRNRWVGMDYDTILEQGGIHDVDQANLLLAAAGRIHAAKRRGQIHFDEMEKSHRRMLGAVLTTILYCRTDLIPPTHATKRAGRSKEDISFTKYVLITTGMIMLVGLAWRKLLTIYYGRSR